MDREIITIAGSVRAEFVEKKSRFIGYAAPADTEEAAQAFLQQIRAAHHDATHNCYAYQLGEDNRFQRSSDDGEPSGTAGRPILEVIRGSGISNVIVVVTRYFGGILLGTGGLVRAYSAAAKDALAAAERVRLTPASLWALTVEYSCWQRLSDWLAAQGFIVQDTRFTDKVDVSFLAPSARSGSLAGELTELLNLPPALLLLQADAVMRQRI